MLICEQLNPPEGVAPMAGAALNLLVIEAVFADDEAIARPQHDVDLVRAHPAFGQTAVLEAVFDGVREMDVASAGRAALRRDVAGGAADRVAAVREDRARMLVAIETVREPVRPWRRSCQYNRD